MDIFGTIRSWNNARQTRKELYGLSAHELHDIGLTRSDIPSITKRIRAQ